MSPRAKKDMEVEVAEVEEPVTEEQQEDKKVFAAATEEFNEHVKALVQNFVQQEIAGLEERVRDLEGLVLMRIGKTGAATPDDSATPLTSVSTGDDVPDYVQSHQQDDGLPWYRG